jgi:uncharacterized alkaline shock family protein YloU
VEPAACPPPIGAATRRPRPGWPERTAITLTLAADYGQDLRALAKRIRSEVHRPGPRVTGLDSVTVSVVIDDVFT